MMNSDILSGKGEKSGKKTKVVKLAAKNKARKGKPAPKPDKV